MRNRTRTTAVGSALIGAGIALLAVSTPATAVTAAAGDAAALPPSSSPSASASASASTTTAPTASATASASTTAAPSASATASTTAAPSASGTASPSGAPSTTTPAPSSSSTATASPSPSPSCPPASSSSADPSASGSTSAAPSGSTSAAPSGSASASASASPTGGILPSLLPQPAPKTAQEPARDETSCRARTVSLSSNATQITAGNAPTLSGSVRDVNGDAIAGATVTIYARAYAQSSYAAIATVRTDSAGRYQLAVRPTKQTSYGANVGDARSPVINLRVYTRVNVSSPAAGSRVANPVTFRGGLIPGYARVAVGLGYLTNGRFVVLAQADTTSTGEYTITSRLPSGTHAFVVFTSAHQGSDRGAKSLTLTVP